jgi:hypothetical protein
MKADFRDGLTDENKVISGKRGDSRILSSSEGRESPCFLYGEMW